MGDKVKKIKKISRQRINIPPDDGPEREDEIMGRAGSSKDTKDPKRKRPSRERWLLTRKTWRYMADAGRRLIPDGALNRPEDIPKIEAYFQEVCHKEPRFLLWRKCSYPGALGFRSHKKNRRDRKKGGSCREKACSADEVEDDKHLSGFALHKTSSGRFDIQKLRQEFLKGSSLSTPSTPDYFSRHKFQKPFSEQKGYLPDLPEVAGFQTEEQSPESEEQEMMDTLLYLLNRGETKETGEESVSETKTVDYTKLLYQLRRYLSNYNLEAKDGSYLASNDNVELVKSDGDEASEGDVAADSDALESDGSSRNVIGVTTTNSRGITTVVKTSDNEKSRNIGKSNNSLSDNNRPSSPGKTVNSGDKTSLSSKKTITSISGKVTNSGENTSSVKTTLEDQAIKIKGIAPFFKDSKKHERNVGIKSRTKTIRDGDREDKSGIGWTSHLRNVGGKSSSDQAGSNDGRSRNVRDTSENKSGLVGSSSGSGLRATSRSPSNSSSPHRSSYSLKENIHFEGDHLQKLLVETLRRYYSKSSSREKVISDLLTDRKLLEKLYYDLRKARGFKGRSGAQVRGTEETQKKNDRPNQESGLKLRHVDSGVIVVGEDSEEEYDEPQLGSWKRLGKPAPRRPKDLPPFSPPPLIEIQHEIEPTTVDKGVQTEPIPTNIMVAIEEEIKREREREENEERQTKLPTGMNRRRSSVDHDDVSQSVSDTIKRYLKMARKKSVDSDKADRFKRVNYDRNLRNIKAKGEITKPGDDDGLNKGCQTDETWTTAIKELKLDEVPISSDTECSPIIDDYSGSRITSSRSSFDGGVCDDTLLSPPAQVYGKLHSPGILSSGQSFLSNLLHGLQQQQQQQSGVTSQPSSPVAAAGVTMQKSKSSSSVVHQGSRLVAKKIWRNRSKSQSRATTSATSAWTPQGQCTWSNVTGRMVTLADTTLLQLTEVERRVMQKVALAKLQALNLGVTVRIPSDAVGNSTAHKPKRRAYLLKRKALTTGFFDTARGKDGDKEKDGSSNATGLVFGIPISQCLENDRLLRNSRGESSYRSRSEVEEPSELCRKSHHGSRSSFSSLIETSVRADESGSCESLMSPTERMAGSVPGLLDTLSCGSAADISGLGERDPGIPHLVASCLRHIEEHGLHTLGIFRVSSSKKRVRQLREDFDCGKEISLDDDLCPHDVATLLKEFFRDLPEPLLCRDLYLAFVQTQRIRNRRLQFEALQHLIQLLPAANRDTLWALLNFLYIVARNSTDHTDEKGEWVSGNKMDSNNLATLFAPNILHCIKPGSNKEIIADSPEERIDVINVIRTMIDHNQQLFKVPADLLDEVYVHMMDSHPEALDHLLRKRDISTEEIIDDLESSATEAGSDSYFIPRTSASLGSDLHEILGSDEPHATPVRRVWSREEFLHESAAMGGPDVSMRPRHKDRDRGRDRGSKKRWRDEASSGGGSDSSSRITSSSGIAGSASSKTRSASVDSGNATGHSGGGASDHSDATSRTLRAAPDELHDAGSRRQSTPVTMDGGGGIITASLKIPVPGSTSAAFSLNLDDADIPYIEDGGGYSVTSEGRQHMTIGVVRPGVGAVPSSLTRRRRQRSASGSDSSSLASTPAYLPQQGYDPTATTPSVCSSVSSPPSWASSPPTSPDSNVTTVDYIPELPSRTKQKTVTLTTKEITPVILQKVMFTSTSELQQVQRGGGEREGTTNKSHSLGLPGELPKSASTSAMGTKRVEFECDLPARESAERKAATSISSIGGAVMRSKTADIERMLRIQKADQSLVGRGRGAAAPQQPPASVEEQDDKKKYSKRRYTDSRHQTRHIPDSDALREGPDSRPVVVIEGRVRQSPAQQVLVYKRRELIASDPKEHETFL